MSVFIDETKAAEIERQRSIREVNEWFAETLAAGHATEGGWRLGMRPEDVTLLTGNFVLAKEAAALGAPIPPVIDMAGQSHSFDAIEDLIELMLEYGQARAALSAEYASRMAAIDA
jgi:hypothetical protein